MGDTSNATRRFKWTGRVFTDTTLTLPVGNVKPEESGLGVCPEWLSPSKKRSSHRDTDALLAALQSEAQHQPLTTLHQGLGRVRRCLLVRTGLSQSFTTLWGKGSCFTAWWDHTYAPSPKERQDSLHWVGWPSISTGCTWSLNRACWAPLLPFCLGLCREGPGLLLSLSVWIWSITCDGNIPLKNKGWRVTGGTSRLQENAISQLHVHHDFSCPVTGRRPKRIHSRFC